MATIVFDFDGVVHKYTNGWQDGSIYDGTNPDVVALIWHILGKTDMSVVIQSTRDPKQVADHLNNLNVFPCEVIPDDIKFYNTSGVVGVTNRKLPALVYIDDRAYHYTPAEAVKHTCSKDFLGEILSTVGVDYLLQEDD